MRQSATETGQLSVRRTQGCEPDGEGVILFLRNLYPQKTAESVAADTGLRPTTVRKWIDRGPAPSFRATLALIAAYGPALLAVAFGRNPPEWLSHAAHVEEMKRLRAEQARIAEKIARMGLEA